MPAASPATSRLALSGSTGINPAGLFWFVLLIATAIPVYWLGFQSLGRAWITPEYSHGPLIPLISLYLFLRELRRAPAWPADTPRNRAPGIALILFALLLSLFQQGLFFAEFGFQSLFFGGGGWICPF